MKTGKSLSELAAALETNAAAKTDYVADTRDITLAPSAVADIDDDGQPFTETRSLIRMRGEELQPSDHCHNQIAAYTGIGTRYYRKMMADSPSLLAGNVNHWFHKDDGKRRMVRTMNDTARAFLSDQFLRLDNEHVAEATLRALQDVPEIETLSTEVTDRRLYMKFAFPRTQGDVGVGDTVQSGCIVRNSETGLGSFEVFPFLNRLVCLNGMVIMVKGNGGYKRRHVGSRIKTDGVIYQQDTIEKAAEAALLECRDAVTTFADPKYFESQLEIFRAAAESEKVTHPVRAVEVLAKSKGFGFTEGEQESILERLIREQDYSQWGMLNAVTNLANDTDSYDRASELEVLGGKVLELNPSQWHQVAQAA